MAYRRKHGPHRSLTFIDETRSASFSEDESSLPSPQLAAHAIRAAASNQDSSSLSSAYGQPTAEASPAHRNPKHLTRSATYASPKDAVTYEYTSIKSLNEAKYGFWGVLARKAKSILEDDSASQQSEDNVRSHPQMLDTSSLGQLDQPNHSPDSYQKSENLSLNRSSEFASLHHIGGTIKNNLEEGLTATENRTADIGGGETRKLQIRRKSGSFSARNQPTDLSASNYFYPNLNDYETQLKASRDVANAMAAKAKLLLRELKTVKADLAFAKERCSQLEEENKLLRECRDKGDILDDDDLIRLQLETLLEEKGRLAHDNSIYSRENRFLREIVEYHQLTMQDVVYVKEDVEEVEEVCPIRSPAYLSHSSPGRLSPIISRPGSSNNSINSSPRSPHINEMPEIFLTAGPASPSSPSPRVTLEENQFGPASPSSPSPRVIPEENQFGPASPSSPPPRVTLEENQSGSSPHSPKSEGLRQQHFLTPA